MNNVPENIHYRVSRTLNGAYRTKTVLFWTLSVLVIILVLALVIIKLNFYIFFIFAVILVPALCFVAKFCAPYIGLKQDYEYVIENIGTFRFTYIYGTRRVPKGECKIKDMKRIAPYVKDDAGIEAQLKECKNVYEMLPDMKKPNQFAYYALFDNKDGEKTAVIFEVSPSILKAFVYYNSANTVTKEFQ